MAAAKHGVAEYERDEATVAVNGVQDECWQAVELLTTIGADGCSKFQ
jgi:hypothetical protein